MALRVWLPLNGDLHNQGLSDIEVTNSGAIVNNNGKIGKCYQFITGTSYLELPASCMTSFTECSVTFWLKILTWNTNYCTFFQAGKNSSFWTDYIFGFLRNSSNSNVCFTVGDGSTSTQSSFLTSNLELNTWYHVALIYKVGKCSIYLNGELDHEYSTSRIIAFNNITRIRLGRSNGTGYQTNCSMNDVRIYDHALSPLEVKKISQGLVLHYRLSGIGGENLLANSKLDGSWTYPSSSYSDKYSPITLKVPNGSIYTLSFDAKSTVNGDKIKTHYYSPNTTTTCVSSQGVTKTASDGNMNFTLSTNWERYWVTYTQTETTAVKHVICPRLESGQGTGTVSVKNVKLEEGDHPTPWCPAPSDELYSTMGLDDNIEYDCSGYGNNGTKTSSITWDGDSPRYTGSYQFNGTNSYVKVSENNWIVQYVKEMTINVWAYADDWTKQTKLFSCTEGGGFNTEGGASGYIRFPRHVATNAGHTTHAYQYNNNGIKLADLDSGWHMFTFVYNTSGEKIYIDGQLYSYGSYTSYGLHFNADARLFLGCEANIANPSAPYFGGKESDFRIYYTALSADDILDLYHLGGSIDSSGTFHTYEYVEGE